eukprot:6958756-Alexandrium_andersonii.AAC.1
MWRLLRALGVFRYKAYVVNGDLQRFDMDTPKLRKQLNALVDYINETSSVTLVDGRIFWGERKPFRVTVKGKHAIDWWRHGDEG